MMVKHWILLPLMAVTLVLTGCSSDEDMMGEEEYVGIPTAGCSQGDNPADDGSPLSASEAEFRNLVVGWGWRPVETHLMHEDGSYDEKDFYEGLYGGGPVIYAFAANGTITSYFTSNAFGRDVYLEHSYSYEAAEKVVYVEENPRFTILSVDDQRMRLIENAGVNRDGPFRLYIVFKRLTSEEMDQVRSTYSVDLRALLESEK